MAWNCWKRPRPWVPELFVLVITAYGTVEDAVTAMRKGAHDFVLKPFSMDELQIKINHCLQMNNLKEENRRLKDELALFQGRMVGDSPAMRQVYETIRKVSDARTTILIEGESGTGKELVAQAIHDNSPWGTPPLCASIARPWHRLCWKASFLAMKKGLLRMRTK